MDRLDALQTFARVVEAGSFTKAAQTLHLSKTTVSQAVQQLEARLRVRLLNRTTRQVRVTPEGADYYERIVKILADLQEVDTRLTSATAAPKGRLRIDVPSPLASIVLVPALPGFHARYPEIQLNLGVSDRPVDVVGDNVDGVLRGGELVDSSLRARRVGDLALGVYAAPHYLARVGTPIDPRELEGSTPHRVVGYMVPRTSRLLPLALSRDGQPLVVHARHVVAIDDGNAYLAAGIAGLGVLVLPRYMAHGPLARGELVPLFHRWDAGQMPLYLVFPPGRHVSARLRVFVSWLEELLARHAPVSVGVRSFEPASR